VDVELVTVEVLVLDRRGNPIHGLKKEDFRLYEDGKQQDIVSFDEVVDSQDQAASPAPGDDGANRGKTVLIVFDDSTIASAHIRPAREAAERFVQEHMRPWDLFAVASFAHSMKIMQNFTHDREQVLNAVRQPAVSSAEPRSRPEIFQEQKTEPDGRRPYEDPGSTKGDARVRDYRAENLLRALQAISLALEPLKGQKSVLLFSESVPYNVEAIETVYRNTLNSARRSNVVFYTLDPGGLASGASARMGTRKPLEPSLSLVRRPGFSAAPNSPGMFMLQQTGGGQGGGTGGAGSGGTSGGSGGAAGGGTPAGTSGGASGYPGGSTRYPSGTGFPDYRSPDLERAWDRSQSTGLLKSLASETGGLSIYNTNDLDGELDKLDRQLSNYYILGFQSNNPKHDGAFRKLEIKTDMKGVTLRYRKSYLDRRPIDVLASSKHEKTLLSALASSGPATQLPVRFRSAYFYDSPRMAKVLVTARIGLEKAGIKKKGGQMAGELHVMGAAYAENGSLAARFSETLSMSFNRDKEQDFRRTFLTYRNYFRLRPGKYRLKLAVSDGANNLGSMEESREIPPFPDSGFAASSLVLAEQVYRLPDLIQNLQTRLLDDNDPLIYSGMRIAPSVVNRLPAGDPIPVFYRIYDTAGRGIPWKLTARAKLVGEKGDVRTSPLIPLDENLHRVGGSEGVVGFAVAFADVEPGKYTLLIETADAASADAATVQADVELTGR
jgi:VWFA-related protein